MTRPLTVNRELDDKAMNKIDHALGRPLDPMVETHRNHYAIHAESDQAVEFRASPYWKCPGEFCGMVYFQVTIDGRRALAAHLKQIGSPHKAFTVRYGEDKEYEDRVVAKTPGEAKYRKFLSCRDGWSELTFKEFCKTASVRRA